MTFASDIARFNRHAMEAVEKDRRAIIIKLFTSVIRDTPVDTGRARNNWLTSVGAPSSGSPNPASKSGADAFAGVTGPLGTLADTVYLTNNVDYIGYLEYGTPKMAPYAMVRRNMSRIVSLVRARK